MLSFFTQSGLMIYGLYLADANEPGVSFQPCSFNFVQPSCSEVILANGFVCLYLFCKITFFNSVNIFNSNTFSIRIIATTLGIFL